MSRSSLRAAGPRMTLTSSARLKVLELLPRGPANGGWGAAWSAYSPSDFDSRVAYAKAKGFNATKMSCCGLPSAGFPSAYQNELNIQDFCNTLRKYGFRFYLGLSGASDFVGSTASQTAVNIALIAANVSAWMKHGAELIVGIDVCNEIQYQQPSTWPGNGSLSTNNAQIADLTNLLAAVRAAAPGTPVRVQRLHGQQNGLRRKCASPATKDARL